MATRKRQQDIDSLDKPIGFGEVEAARRQLTMPLSDQEILASAVREMVEPSPHRGRPPVVREREERERFAAEFVLAWLRSEGDFSVFEPIPGRRGHGAVYPCWRRFRPGDAVIEFVKDGSAEDEFRSLTLPIRAFVEALAVRYGEAVRQTNAALDADIYQTLEGVMPEYQVLIEATERRSNLLTHFSLIRGPGLDRWSVESEITAEPGALLVVALTHFLSGGFRLVRRCPQSSHRNCPGVFLVGRADREYCSGACERRARKHRKEGIPSEVKK